MLSEGNMAFIAQYRLHVRGTGYLQVVEDTSPVPIVYQELRN